MELFQREQRQPKENSGAGGLCATAYMRLGAELSYQRRAEKTMADENCFKIYIVSSPLPHLLIFLREHSHHTLSYIIRTTDLYWHKKSNLARIVRPRVSSYEGFFKRD